MLSFREYAQKLRKLSSFSRPSPSAPDINLHEGKLNNTMVSADLTFQAPKKKKVFLARWKFRFYFRDFSGAKILG